MATDKNIEIVGFKGFDETSGNLMRDRGDSPDCQNVLTDKTNGSIERMSGYAEQSRVPAVIKALACDEAWTPSSNVTCSADTTDYIEGSAAAKAIVAAGFTDGLLCYKDLSTTASATRDFSDAVKVCFWIKSDIGIADGKLNLLIDNTPGCGSAVETLAIGALTGGVWTKKILTLAAASSLTAVISFGLSVTTGQDVGTATIWIDDICMMSTNEQLLHDCETAWTASANVSSATDAVDYKVGTKSVQLTVAAGFSTGLIAYANITRKDIHTARMVKFWIKSSVNLAAEVLKFVIDDKAACASPVENLNLPALVAGEWQCIYLALNNYTTDLGLLSIGLYANSPTGACVIHVDDVRATRPIVSSFTFAKDDGSSWVIATDGCGVFASTDGLSWNDPIQFGLDTNYRPVFASIENTLFCVNGDDWSWSWNGTATTVYAGADGSAAYMPKGRSIVSHNRKLFIGYADGDPYTIRYSDYSVAPGLINWFPGVRALECVGGGDAIQNLTAIDAYGKMLIWMGYDIWVLAGYDKTDFDNGGLQRLGVGVGLRARDSVAIKSGLVHFVGGTDIYQSLYAVGPDFFPKQVTMKADRLLGKLKSADETTQYWTQSLASEFDDGTYGVQCIDLTTQTGRIKMKGQDSDADWIAGTKDAYIDIVTVPGQVQLKNDYDTGAPVGTNSCLGAAVTASYVPGVVSHGTTADIVDNNFSTYYGITASAYPGRLDVVISVDMGAIKNIRRINWKVRPYVGTGYSLTVDVSTDNSNWTNVKTVTSNTNLDFDLTLANMTQMRYLRFTGACTGAIHYSAFLFYEIQAFETTYTYQPEGNFVSQTLDSGTTQTDTGLGNLVVDVIVPSGASIAFYGETQAADAAWPVYSDTWTTLLGTATSSGIWSFPMSALTTRRYRKIKAKLTSNASNSETSVVKSMYYGVPYIGPAHQCLNVGSWRNFEAAYTANGGVADFYMRGGSDQSACESATWQKILPNQSIPFISTNNWVQAMLFLDANTSSGAQPYLDSYTINWSNLSGSAVPITDNHGFTHDGRYVLAGAEAPKNYSDSLLIVDKNDNLIVGRGFPIGASTNFRKNTWFGSSKERTINTLWTQYSQNGNDYDSYWVFGEYVLTGRSLRKMVKELWIDVRGETSGNVEVDVSIDGGAWESLDDIDLTGTSTLVFRRGLDQYGENRTMSIRVLQNEAGSKFIMDRLEIIFESLPRSDGHAESVQ